MILDQIQSERLREIIRTHDDAIDSGELPIELEPHIVAVRRDAAAELTRRHHQGATEVNPND